MSFDYKCPGVENTIVYPFDRSRIYTDSIYMTEAAERIRESENSRFLKLPLDYGFEKFIFAGDTAGYKYENITELKEIFSVKYDAEKFSMLFESIEKSRKKGPVLLRAEGAFSILASLINPVHIIKALKKDRAFMMRLMEHISEVMLIYISESLKYGVSVISYADPVGTVELVGQAEYAKSIGKSTYAFLERLSPVLQGTVVHLCKKSSVGLEKCGYIQAIKIPLKRMQYAQAVIDHLPVCSVKYIGHGCINCELLQVDHLWGLELKENQGRLDRMHDRDKEQVFGIYEEAILSGKSTYIRQLPSWEKWDREHYKEHRFVYRIEDQAVGFAVLGKFRAGQEPLQEAQISIYVHKDYRRRGVGETLLRKVIEDTAKKDIVLKALIFSDNLASICLHKKMGFKKRDEKQIWVSQGGSRRKIYEFERKTVAGET